MFIFDIQRHTDARKDEHPRLSTTHDVGEEGRGRSETQVPEAQEGGKEKLQKKVSRDLFQ